MAIKFAAPKTYRNIFTPGKLSDLCDTILKGTDRKDYVGLSLDELAKLPTIYASINPKEGESIRTLKDDKVYKTANGEEVLGLDIKAITMVMYQCPRTAYVEFGRTKQVHESNYSGAVPIPMLGFKRFRNISYDSWRQSFKNLAYINDDLQIVDQPGALEKAFGIDLLLGKAFASTVYNAATDQIEWDEKGRWGLLLLSTLQGEFARPDATAISLFRDLGMGNHRGTFSTAFGTARISIDRVEDKKMKLQAEVFNRCNNMLRLMYTQRWVWFGNHRNTDMICDFQNWDNMPEKVDTVTNAFVGLKPKDNQKVSGLASLMGIGK